MRAGPSVAQGGKGSSSRSEKSVIDVSCLPHRAKSRPVAHISAQVSESRFILIARRLQQEHPVMALAISTQTSGHRGGARH